MSVLRNSLVNAKLQIRMARQFPEYYVNLTEKFFQCTHETLSACTLLFIEQFYSRIFISCSHLMMFSCFRDLSTTGTGGVGPCMTAMLTTRTNSHSRRATSSWSSPRKLRTRTGWRESWSPTLRGEDSFPAPSSTFWATDHRLCHGTRSNAAALSRMSRIMTASHINQVTLVSPEEIVKVWSQARQSPPRIFPPTWHSSRAMHAAHAPAISLSPHNLPVKIFNAEKVKIFHLQLEPSQWWCQLLAVIWEKFI